MHPTNIPSLFFNLYVYVKIDCALGLYGWIDTVVALELPS
jgi:hypothetical protein